MTPTTSPPPTRTAQAKPAYGEARGELIGATVRVVARRGMRGLSHRSVAAEAGVAHGLIGHYFGSTTALLAATLDAVLERSLVVDPVALLLREPPASGAELTSWIRDVQEIQVFEYEVHLAARREQELRPLSERLYRGYAEFAARAYEQAGYLRPDDAVLDAVTAAIDGIVLQSVTFRDTDDPRLQRAMLAIRDVVRDGAVRAD
ncbi:TetR/AcrR family transcriptional regulator [Mycetocola reblochoni]|uniref:Transcriptional regulator, TetR family n=2 Tax=Mycetocola reblochoni TaxID=331618 RepID=A0A1R4KAU0_9MICO|nr:TetR family transcriptional regulator [Mycetocola reblochoni]RLP71197.1 TetR/AcrR family transcriptional regulator [Mycetocola reblochoni]SJN41255.1 Transcriptional regulator, TetR family [Mycetocola reblochoni REB411]